MKNIYAFLLLFFISFTAFSQDKKFSIELNYPIELAQGINKVTGIANAGLKYRFFQGEIFSYGAFLSGDYLRRDGAHKYMYPDLNFDSQSLFFLHIGGFAEMTIPGAEKLHPFFGLGPSYSTYDYLYVYSYYDYREIETRTERDPGYHLSFGIQYDISSSFFIQSYFQFIRTFDKTELDDGEIFKRNTNHHKLGIGFRF